MVTALLFASLQFSPQIDRSPHHYTWRDLDNIRSRQSILFTARICLEFCHYNLLRLVETCPCYCKNLLTVINATYWILSHSQLFLNRIFIAIAQTALKQNRLFSSLSSTTLHIQSSIIHSHNLPIKESWATPKEFQRQVFSIMFLYLRHIIACCHSSGKFSVLNSPHCLVRAAFDLYGEGIFASVLHYFPNS